MKLTQTQINWSFTILITILLTSFIMFPIDTNQKLKDQITKSDNIKYILKQFYVDKSDYQFLTSCTNNKSLVCQEALQEIVDGK